MSDESLNIKNKLTLTEKTLQGGGLFLAILLFLCSIYLVWYLTVDDAYITLRQARNLVQGEGFVYNPGGPRVESYTNHLLFLYQALCMWLGLDGLYWTKILGSFAGIVTILGSFGLTRDLLRWNEMRLSGVSSLALLTGPVILAVSPMLILGATSGLETTLFAALITLGAWGFLRLLADDEQPGYEPVLTGVFFGLATWTRPEGIAWLLGFFFLGVLFRWRREKSLSPLLIAGGIGLLFWISLIGWRLIIFGYPHPNTYYVKMSGSKWIRISNGLGYLRRWGRPNAGFFYMALCLAGLVLSKGKARMAFGVAYASVFGLLFLTVLEGGDWMPHLRLFVPGAGILSALVGTAVCFLLIKSFDTSRFFSWIAIGVTGTFLFALQYFLYDEYEMAIREAYTRALGWADSHRPLGIWLGEWNQQRLEEEEPPLLVAIEDIGRVGWESNATIIDLAGLADPELAHFRYESPSELYPADELIHQQRPEVVVIISLEGHRIFPLKVLFRSNQAIYHHPDFVKNYREKVMFTHKDYPGDGYFLHAFIRKDIFDQAPDVVPPEPRAILH